MFSDTDDDGLALIIEYFMDLHPREFSGSYDDLFSAETDPEDGSLIFCYRRSNSTPLAAVGIVEWSFDLVDWFTTGVTEFNVIPMGSYSLVKVRISVEVGEAKVVRLRIELVGTVAVVTTPASRKRSGRSP